MKNNIDKFYFETKEIKYLAGIDEAGRGSLAGPIIVASVILPINYFNAGINDSKLLSYKKREKLYEEIIENCIDYSIVEVSVRDIEKFNPKKSSILGMENCIKKLNIKPEFILTDAEKINSLIYEPIISGDKKSQTIAAASIIAKVYRDKLMEKYDNLYPEYDFKNNKGYGTKNHLAGLRKFGPTKIHRKTYKPVSDLL